MQRNDDISTKYTDKCVYVVGVLVTVCMCTYICMLDFFFFFFFSERLVSLGGKHVAI